MDTDHYEPERTEEILRRRLILIGAGFMTPVFIWFAVLEYSSGGRVMLLVSIVGAMVCVANLLLARFIGLNLPVLRWSIAYMFCAVLYYVSTDSSSSSLLFCLALPFASSFLLGYREAAVWNVVLGLCCMLMIINAVPLEIPSIEPYLVDFLVSYIFVVIVANGYEQMRSIAQERALEENKRLQLEIENKNRIAAKNERLFEDLNNALKEVRELTGLIPICASCKKIRGDGGDEGFWEHVEAYLHKRTRLTFSHSICPGCSDEAMEALDASAGLRV